MAYSLLFIVVFLLRSYQFVEAFGCSIPRENKIRTFDSIIHYQGNKLPFNSLNPGWEGSSVLFTCRVIDELQKNTFITHDSQSIVSLNLSNKHIKEIDDGAFISLICLKELYLDHNNITKITNGVFQDLTHLTKLEISFNKIEVLQDSSFSNLRSLKFLNLANNRIKDIQVLAFDRLNFLDYLNLEQNQINRIPENLFRPLSNLTTLILSWNKLGHIESEKWNGLASLQKLDLVGNNLNRFDPSYSFSFKSLKSLNLSYNSLTMLDVVQLRTAFTQLEVLDVNNNPWLCSTLKTIIYELSDSKIKLFALNHSHNMGIDGIACSEHEPITLKSTTPISLSSTGKQPVFVDENEMEQYVEKKIDDNNIELRGTIESVRTFVIFVFGLLVIFIVFEILQKTNICGSVINRLRGTNNLYVDEGDLENFRLLHTRR